MPIPGFRSDVLRQARERAGLTRSQLAELADVHSGDRVGAWERGVDQPTASMLPRIAAALGIDPLELLEVHKDGPGLAALRVASGLTLSDLAKRSGISYGRCQRIERGALVPDEEVATQLGIALGVSAADVRAAAGRRSR